jgi:prepilin-type processing-associated H-X9-DG protein
MTGGVDGSINSRCINPNGAIKPLIVCIHGGGCNAAYFDLPGFSFCDRAVVRGYPVLLINRPGHGGSAPVTEGGFKGAAEAILAYIQNTLSVRRLAESGWFMVGHSIGGAIATIIAGGLQPRDLRGVALSGIGDSPTLSAHEWAQRLNGRQSDIGLANGLLFGPQNTFSWRAPKALRSAAEPWRPIEVEETLKHWPRYFSDIARRVTVPVHLRLADAERIWENGPLALKRLAASFVNAPGVDCSLLPEGGHLYEVHHRGHELMASQLDFFDHITASLDPDRIVGIPGRP